MNDKELFTLIASIAFLMDNGWSVWCEEDDGEVFAVAEYDDYNRFVLSNKEEVEKFLEKYADPFERQD